MRRWGSLVRLSLALLGCTAIQAFLVPLGGRTAQIGIASSIRSTKVFSAVQEPPTASPITDPDEYLNSLEDINDYYEPTPVELTQEQLATMTKEMYAMKVKDGRTIKQWLDQDDPTFTDGSRVAAWVQEVDRLRYLSFIERSEQLKSLSFEELNAFRFRSSEWKELLIEQGIVEPLQPAFPEEGVRVLSEEDHQSKLRRAREEFADALEEEAALLENVDRMLEAGVFEGKALDNQVSVSMNGHMVPLSCSISEEAFARVDHKSLSQALEAAMEQAFKKAADFYEETFADYEAQAKTPTDIQGISELLGRKEFDTVEDVTHPQFS